MHKGQGIDPELFTNPNAHACKACMAIYAKRRYEAKGEKLRADTKEWKKANLNKAYSNGPIWKAKYLSEFPNVIWLKAIRFATKGLGQNAKHFSGYPNLFGCTKAQFFQHIKSQFRPGMGVSNYGDGPLKWKLDHLIPITAFDLSTREGQLSAFNFKNIKPQWSRRNK